MADWLGLGDLGNGPVAEAAEAAMRVFEDEQRKLVELQRALDEESVTVRAKDRSLSMTFDGRGELTGIKFVGSKFRSMAPAALAQLLVDTVHAGRAQCMEKLGERMGSGPLPGVNMAELAMGKADPAAVVQSLVSPMLGPVGDEPSGETRSGSSPEKRGNQS